MPVVEYHREKRLELDEALKILEDRGFSIERDGKKIRIIEKEEFQGIIQFTEDSFEEAYKLKPEPPFKGAPVEIKFKKGNNVEFKKDGTLETYSSKSGGEL